LFDNDWRYLRHHWFFDSKKRLYFHINSVTHL
jgi:hypothetical protein